MKLLTCILTMLCAPAFGQKTMDTIFNNYYRKGLIKVEEIYGMRGLPEYPACSYLKETDDFHEDINFYMENNFRNTAGILFYGVENDSLRIWLVKRHSWTYSSAAITKEKLVEAEYNLRQSLKVEALSLNRAVVPKNIDRSVLKKPIQAKQVSMDDAINAATQILLPPVIAKQLAGLEHVYIVSEFNIGQFPFHLLRPFKSKAYLVDSLSYSFIPHLCNFRDFLYTSFDKISKKYALAASHPVIIGNPSFSHKAPFDMPALPGAEMEAKMVAGNLKSAAIIGEAATVSDFEKKAENADFIYLATHGYFDFEKLLDGSFLAFAPDSAHPEGMLTAREIQQQRLKAEVAILSACQTGFGKVYAGGAMGLGRAFNIAGVKFTVISLWSVDDEATKELMTAFVGNMKMEDDYFPAQPLRKAILEVKKKYENPVYWAPFAVFGFTY